MSNIDKEIPKRGLNDRSSPLDPPTLGTRLHPYKSIGTRRGKLVRMVDSWRETGVNPDQRWLRRYQWLQTNIASLIFVATAVSAFAMVGLFAVGIWRLIIGIAAGFGLDLEKYFGQIHEVAASHLKESDVMKTHGMVAGLQALELLILAPLPYLLMLGLGRYVDTLAHSKDAKTAKMELLDFKAFEVALFIAIIAAWLVGRLFGLNSEDKVDHSIFGWCALIIAALVGYFWILEHLGSIHDQEFSDHPKDFYRLLASAVDAKFEENWTAAAANYREAAHYALSHKGEDDARPWRAMANYALCVQLDACQRKVSHDFSVGVHIMHEATCSLLRIGDYGFVQIMWEEIKDFAEIFVDADFRVKSIIDEFTDCKVGDKERLHNLHKRFDEKRDSISEEVGLPTLRQIQDGKSNYKFKADESPPESPVTILVEQTNGRHRRSSKLRK